MGRAESKKRLEKLLKEFSAHSPVILIESAISGEEYSCPVLDYPDSTSKPLLPVLIKPVDSSFFDYTAKYTEGACEEIVPAPCSAELTERMQLIALKAHTILKCSGVSRTDMIVKDNEIFTLEINTLPGFTSASLVPKSFAAMGGTFSELLDIIIETALAGKK
jgi:D-alanine-D-alanine ligase